MDPLLILAVAAAAGVFLVFSGLAMPPSVRLERPERGLMKNLQDRLDAAELPLTAHEFVASTLGVAVGVAVVALILGAPALAVAGLVISPVAIWQRYEGRRDNFRQEYDESLADAVQLLREGFSAVGSVRDALDHAARNGQEPAVADFREVRAGQAAGDGLEAAFAPVLARRKNPYLRMVAETLALKESAGGSASEVLQGLETMIREQTHLQREIAAKQSQAKLESLIVSAAPVMFFLVMKLLPWMREYEQGFYRTLLGQIVLSAAIIFSMASYAMSRWIATRGLTLEVKEVAA